MSTEAAIDPKLADRFALKAFVEACLVLEEGVAGVRDVDLGMMMGTGMIPGPFARADLRGLDDVLAALEQAEEDWGEHFEPPLILRRLVAQGRLGLASGQGFYAYPQADEGEQAPQDPEGRIQVWSDRTEPEVIPRGGQPAHFVVSKSSERMRVQNVSSSLRRVDTRAVSGSCP